MLSILIVLEVFGFIEPHHTSTHVHGFLHFLTGIYAHAVIINNGENAFMNELANEVERAETRIVVLRDGGSVRTGQIAESILVSSDVTLHHIL